MNSLVFPAKDLALQGGLWPSAEYDEQLASLREHIDKPLYLVVMNLSDTHLSVSLENKANSLLDIVTFSRPDAEQHLFPHMLVFSDGRGLNLGRILRASLDRPFEPADENIVYQQTGLVRHLLFQPRQISKQTISDTSRQQLARLLGRQTDNQIE